jgi:hypothetical protein
MRHIQSQGTEVSEGNVGDKKKARTASNQGISPSIVRTEYGAIGKFHINNLQQIVQNPDRQSGSRGLIPHAAWVCAAQPPQCTSREPHLREVTLKKKIEP